MEQVQLINKQAPGDVLMMTCAVRDLHTQYPGQFVTEMDTSCQGIWDNNPFHQQINRARPHRVLEVGYSMSIQQCNQRRSHFSTGFAQDLGYQLKVKIKPSSLRPDIYLSDEEMDPAKRMICQPYWIVVAGGKSDFTVKLWDTRYYQDVVDQLRGQAYFVQVGSKEQNHRHVGLRGATNLIGKTTFRQLMSLVYHAEGVVCPVTCVMHLAGAFNKPAVVIAGGREPWWWEAYTENTWNASCVTQASPDMVNQVYLHTMGKFRCCAKGGCWKNGVGEKKNGKNCRLVDDGPTMRQPACMKSVRPEQVVDAIHRYSAGEHMVAEELPEKLGPPLYTENPKTPEELQALMQSIHVPRKRYGPKRRGERHRAPVI